MRVRVEAPASTANLGLGFDTLSAPIFPLADRVEAWLEWDQEGVILDRVEGPHADYVEHGNSNTAVEAARIVARASGWNGRPGILLRLWKGVPPGKGLGSSGASAAAAALAVARLLGYSGVKGLVRAAGRAEAIAAGTPHYDNVAASITRRLVVVAEHEGDLIVEELGPAPPILVAIPRVETPPSKTKLMRSVLPESVPLKEAVGHWQRLAALVVAISRRDWHLAGRLMMSDRIVEPSRAKYVPCYVEARRAALEAGAYAAFISGAGPSVGFLVDESARSRVEEAVAGAYEECGVGVDLVYSPGAP